jgi:hypothetical protein
MMKAAATLAMRSAGRRRIRARMLVGSLLKRGIATVLGLPARMLAYGARNIALQFYRLDRDDEPEDDGNW